jgi:hypothetical protein
VTVVKRQFRKLYDTLLDKYIPIFLEGRKNHIDVIDINKRFKTELKIKQK